MKCQASKLERSAERSSQAKRASSNVEFGVASLKIIQKSNIKSFSLTFWSKLRHLVAYGERLTLAMLEVLVAYGERSARRDAPYLEKSYKSIQIKLINFERFEKICEISVTK